MPGRDAHGAYRRRDRRTYVVPRAEQVPRTRLARSGRFASGERWCGSLANSLAASLLTHGLAKLSESSVGIFIHEPKWAIIAMLAIMKTGNPYVPLGSTAVRQPRCGCIPSRCAEPHRWLQTERSRFIIEDSKIKIVIADNEGASE